MSIDAKPRAGDLLGQMGLNVYGEADKKRM